MHDLFFYQPPTQNLSLKTCGCRLIVRTSVPSEAGSTNFLGRNRVGIDQKKMLADGRVYHLLSLALNGTDKVIHFSLKELGANTHEVY